MTPETLSVRLVKACVAACNCMTKSPELEFHSETCHYRLHAEAVDRIADLEAALKPCADAWGIALKVCNQTSLTLAEMGAISKYHLPSTAFATAYATLSKGD